MNINLARKWRSRTFDEMVGQDLSVRMLKNSLYLDHYFPVYLFSGQRGCGKTTAARIFAAAVNCFALASFQKTPKEYAIPCLTCESCRAMQHGKHPDFIEIDGASYTGVDNVRQIIDAATLMPVLGRKRIYLIDEAHMLSKAAFNAFLKILEEPPQSVFFILATTDPQKIIETVTSRCFRVLFKPIEKKALVEHLQKVCTTENISFEQEGLELIVQQSDGSARDALNTLEQVRFAHEHVTKSAVLENLGYLDDEQLVTVLLHAVSGQTKELLSALDAISWQNCSVSYLWDQSIQVLRHCFSLSYGVEPEGCQKEIIMPLVNACSGKLLSICLDTFYAHEQLFLKSSDQRRIFEFVLLKINSHQLKAHGSSGNEPLRTKPHVQLQEYVKPNVSEARDERWQSFLSAIQELDDPLLLSIFTQAHFIQCVTQDKVVHVGFSKDVSFFEEILEASRSHWLPLLQNNFALAVTLKTQFDQKYITLTHSTEQQKNPSNSRSIEEKKTSQKVSEKREASSGAQRPVRMVKKNYKSTSAIREKVVDVSDAKTWQKTHLVLTTFPGTVVEFNEDVHG